MILYAKRITFKVNSRIVTAKAEFNKKKKNISSANWKKRVKCYIWRIVFYVVESWTL